MNDVNAVLTAKQIALGVIDSGNGYNAAIYEAAANEGISRHDCLTALAVLRSEGRVVRGKCNDTGNDKYWRNK